jgi:hypothetical protein
MKINKLIVLMIPIIYEWKIIIVILIQIVIYIRIKKFQIKKINNHIIKSQKIILNNHKTIIPHMLLIIQ